MTIRHDHALPTVVALHSSGASGRQWRALAAALEGTHRVLAPDLHGHGHAPPVPLTPATIVAADAELVARLVVAAPNGVHLVGHSYGAAVALKVARRCATHVRSLALVEPVAFRMLFDRYARRRPAAEIHELGRAMHTLVRTGRSDIAAQRFVVYWGGDDAWHRLGPDARASVASRMGAIAAHFDALASDDDLTLESCRHIVAPTLLIAGTATRTPALRIAELVASALPGVRDVRMPGGNHVEVLEAPGRIVGRIVRLVAEVDARVTAPLMEAA